MDLLFNILNEDSHNSYDQIYVENTEINRGKTEWGKIWWIIQLNLSFLKFFALNKKKHTFVIFGVILVKKSAENP